MIHPAIIFSIITFAAGMALAYRNKARDESQTRKAYSEVRILKK